MERFGSFSGGFFISGCANGRNRRHALANKPEAITSKSSRKTTSLSTLGAPSGSSGTITIDSADPGGGTYADEGATYRLNASLYRPTK